MNSKMIEIFLLLFIIVGVQSNQAEPFIVSLPNGQISGHAIESGNKYYYAYQEIPYASPPVGNLRFKEPTPPQNWEGILDTTKNTKMCYQEAFLQTPGVEITEDCLYLNVYTPRKPGDNSSDLLPVLLYIHGGAFTSGSGGYQEYGPSYFIDHDIVVVTINYRLGPLGFLTTNDGVIPANLGLKDQNFALKWTNQNIELFGGDPAKITIAGESSGAHSVGHLVFSKKSDGLFRGAILQSGTAISYAAYQTHYTYYAYQLGSILDESININNTSRELLEVLQNAPASDIINANVTAYEGEKDLKWTPVIEDESIEDAFVVGPMEDNLEKGNINKVPLLLGFNSDEALGFLAREQSDIPGYLKLLGTSYDKDLSKLINNKYNITIDNVEKAGGRLRDIYTNGLFQDNPAGIVKFLSDSEFTTPIIRHAAIQSNYADVYLYQFSYKGHISSLDLVIEGTDNVGHAEEMSYLWDSHEIDWSIQEEDDTLTHHRLVQLWTNFIKYSNPTPAEDDLLENIQWSKVSSNNITYLNINTTLEVQTNPKKYQEWKSVFDIYAMPPLSVY